MGFNFLWGGGWHTNTGGWSIILLWLDLMGRRYVALDGLLWSSLRSLPKRTCVPFGFLFLFLLRHEC